jgi:hypothetical protein
MERELAKHIVATGFHSNSVLQELIQLLKRHCIPDEYEQFAKAIASIIAETSLEILNPIFKNTLTLRTRWMTKSINMES